MNESIKSDSLKRVIQGKEIGTNLVSYNLSNTAEDSFTVLNGRAVYITATLRNSNDLQLFATSHLSIYENSVSEANKVPSGTNVDASEFKLGFWYDLDSSDGKNVKFIAYILNNTASSKTIIVRVNFRYIIEASVVS